MAYQDNYYLHIGSGNLTWYTPNFLTTASFNSYIASISTPNLAQVLAVGSDASNQPITDLASLTFKTIAGNVTLSADVNANYSLTLPASSGLSASS